MLAARGDRLGFAGLAAVPAVEPLGKRQACRIPADVVIKACPSFESLALQATHSGAGR